MRFSSDTQIQQSYDENITYSKLVEAELFESIYEYLDATDN